jgi:hypothetical protein
VADAFGLEATFGLVTFGVGEAVVTCEGVGARWSVDFARDEISIDIMSFKFFVLRR